MIIKHRHDVPAVDVSMEGAKDVQVRVLLGPDDQTPTFAMRVFDFAPGGHTPYHDHPFEHEILILSGNITIVTPEGEQPVRVDDVIYVAPNETHQFKNRSGSEPASMMCLVPIAYQP